MLTAEENARLTEIEPGTPMGEVFRRYWFPIAGTIELDQEPTKPIRLLGENLVLYKDRQGRYGLLDRHCVHRRASLVFGIPEEQGLRCFYHGWMYDHEGRCVEQPTEDMTGTESFRDRTRIKAYPVEELGGLIWAYLGPEPVPLLPRWEQLVRGDRVRSIGWLEIPCNWLQIMENSVDQTHVEWLHRYFDNYVLERTGRSDLKHDVWHHKKIGFDLYEHGIIKRRVYHAGTEDDPDWRIGHPLIFPHIICAGANSLEIRVPVDNTHTMNYFYMLRPRPADAAPIEPGQKEPVSCFPVPLPGLNRENRPTWDLLDSNSGQDVLAMYTQGPITDRSNERLSTVDVGVIMYRKLLAESIEKVSRGEDPMCVFRDPAENVSIHIPTEDDEGGAVERQLRNVGNRRPTGLAQKYDPALDGKTGAELQAEIVAAKR